MNNLIINSRDNSKNFGANFRLLILFVFLSLLTKALAGILVLIAKKFGFEKISEVLASKLIITDLYDNFTALVFVVILYPIIEEFAFRGWLTRNPKLVAVSLTFLVFHILRIILFKSTGNTLISMPVEQIIFIILSTASAFLLIKRFSFKICSKINSHTTIFMVLSILSFSAIHLTNFSIAKYDFATILSLLIILITYPIRGYLYTVIRIRCGLIWSITLHMLNNSIVIFSFLNLHSTE